MLLMTRHAPDIPDYNDYNSPSNLEQNQHQVMYADKSVFLPLASASNDEASVFDSDNCDTPDNQTQRILQLLSSLLAVLI